MSAADRHIPTSTTDVVPELASRLVARSTVVWATDHDSMAAAHAAMITWARDNGYDAVVGLRCEIVPHVTGKVSTSFTHGTSFSNTSGYNATTVKYNMYGTAVGYQS